MQNNTVDSIQPIQSTRGFTLLELLVAIALLAVISILSWRGLDTMLRSRETLTARDLQLDGLRRVFAQFDTDCQHLVPLHQLLSNVPIDTNNQQLSFIRNRFQDGEPGRWQIVRYQIFDGTLWRTTLPAVDHRQALVDSWRRALTLQPQSFTDGTQSLKMLEGIQTLTVRVMLRPNPGQPGEWYDDPAALSAALLAVQSASNFSSTLIQALELTLGDQQGRRYVRLCQTGL